MNFKTLLLLFVFCSPLAQLKAQFLRGVGIFGSGTTSRHQYVNTNPVDSTNIHAMPENHNAAERISWGAGAVVEMLPFERFRLRTELEYINKGSKENELLNPFTDEHQKGTNKYSYIGLNNFLTFRLEGDYAAWYILAGARLEYNLRKSTPAYSYVAGNFRKLAISPDVGIGTELITLGRFRWFTELHYNPDVFKQYKKDQVWANNRTWELRIGVMLRPKRMLDIDCNAPRYIEY
jgi:hypothetical protein